MYEDLGFIVCKCKDQLNFFEREEEKAIEQERDKAWQEVQEPRRHQNRMSCSHIQSRISYQISLSALLVPLLGVSSSLLFFVLWFFVVKLYFWLDQKKLFLLFFRIVGHISIIWFKTPTFFPTFFCLVD